MGLWPPRGDVNQRRPRESGDPSSVQWIPAFAGMTSPGTIFRSAAGGEESRSTLKITKAGFLAEITPSGGARFFAPLRMTSAGLRMTSERLGIAARARNDGLNQFSHTLFHPRRNHDSNSALSPALRKQQ